jgi:hypothetical protein
MYGHEVQGLESHIYRDKSSKTVCVSTVLAYFGILPNQYTVTSTNKNIRAYHGILRSFGFGVRSRKSHTKKAKSVGQLRKLLPSIAKKETEDVIAYMVMVEGHLMVLDAKGKTIVDTAPRKRDARRLIEVHAIINKG